MGRQQIALDPVGEEGQRLLAGLAVPDAQAVLRQARCAIQTGSARRSTGSTCTASPAPSSAPNQALPSWVRSSAAAAPA